MNQDIEKIFGIIQELKNETNGLSPEQVNQVPFENSWTAGQLLEHLRLSAQGLSEGMSIPYEDPGRPSTQAFAKLEKIFLDFDSKMQSPEFIRPGEGPFNASQQLNEIEQSIQQMSDAAGKTDLSGLVKGLPLGDITKEEIIHFVMVHMTRHLHQLKRIVSQLPEHH